MACGMQIICENVCVDTTIVHEVGLIGKKLNTLIFNNIIKMDHYMDTLVCEIHTNFTGKSFIG